jgi:tetratricopeptide (TPR) repeat protein
LDGDPLGRPRGKSLATQPQTVNRTEGLNGGDRQTPLEKGRSLLEQARAAPPEEATSRFEQAIDTLEEARAAGADPLEVNLALAQGLLGLRRPDQARLSLRRAIAADSSSDEAYRTMEEALAQLGSGDEWRVWADELDERYRDEYALRAYERAVEANPDDVEARLGGGLLCFKQGRIESALDWYGQAEHRVLDRVDAIRVKLLSGGALVELERYEDALERLAAAIELSVPPPGIGSQEAEAYREALWPLIAWAHYLSGSARLGLGDYPEALEDFERARTGEGGLRLFALQAEVAVLWRQGDYVAAWHRLAEVPDLDEGPGLTRELRSDIDYLIASGDLLRVQRKWEQAARVYEWASEQADDDPRVWLGRLMLCLDQRDEDPSDADKWDSRARPLFERFREDIKRQLRKSEGGPQDADALRLRVTLLLALGALLVEMRHNEDAKLYLSEAIRISGDIGMGWGSVSHAHAYLGLAHTGSGDYPAAAASLEEALTYEGRNLDYKVRLADVLTRLELFERAERLYREVLERAPNNVDARIGLGEALTGLGDARVEDGAGRAGAGDPDLYQDAREQFTRALRIAEETGVKAPVRLRTGSRSLNARERAALHYTMGYGCVMLHRIRPDRRRLVPRPLGPLAQARRDFRRATKADPTHAQAARALRRLKDERGSRAPQWGALLLASICVLLLAAVQAAFYLKGSPNAIEEDAMTYTVLTFGLLGFFLAALSLPELLKLRVGGVVLEKSRSEPLDVGTTLPISRGEPFTSRFSPRLAEVRTVLADRDRRRPQGEAPRRDPGPDDALRGQAAEEAAVQRRGADRLGARPSNR